MAQCNDSLLFAGQFRKYFKDAERLQVTSLLPTTMVLNFFPCQLVKGLSGNYCFIARIFCSALHY